MPPDPLPSPGGRGPLLCLNADVNHRDYRSARHLSLALSTLPFLILLPHLSSSHLAARSSRRCVALLAIVIAAGGPFKVG